MEYKSVYLSFLDFCSFGLKYIKSWKVPGETPKRPSPTPRCSCGSFWLFLDFLFSLNMPYSPRNTLLTPEHPTLPGAPYSPWNTLLTAEHSTHSRPAPRGKPYSLNRKILLKKSVCKSQHLIHGHCNL